MDTNINKSKSFKISNKRFNFIVTALIFILFVGCISCSRTNKNQSDKDIWPTDVTEDILCGSWFITPYDGSHDFIRMINFYDDKSLLTREKQEEMYGDWELYTHINWLILNLRQASYWNFEPKQIKFLLDKKDDKFIIIENAETHEKFRMTKRNIQTSSN